MLKGATQAPRRALATLAAVLLVATPASASTGIERLSERGPPAFAVGLLFTLASPFAMAYGAATGGRVALHACRLGHGVKMLAGGVVLLPAGLLASPFHLEAVPGGWMDGMVEAFQEDTCTRPLGSFYP